MTFQLNRYNNTWVESFFSNPNGLLWTHIVNQSAPPDLVNTVLPWLAPRENGKIKSPIILPFVYDNKIKWWYATAENQVEFSVLNSELLAWLGTSYLSELEIVPTSSEDLMGEAMRMCFESNVIRFSGSDSVNQTIISRVETYRKIIDLRPKNLVKIDRPVGTILADFEKSLILADPILAQEYYDELVSSELISEQNQKFLTIRMYAGLGDWGKIVNNKFLIQEIVSSKLPVQVREDLLNAHYHFYLKKEELTESTDKLVECFVKNILEPYPKLFVSRVNLQSTAIVKQFLLRESELPEPNLQKAVELLNLIPNEDTSKELYESIANRISAGEQQKSEEEKSKLAETLMKKYDFEGALEILLDLSISEQSIRLMLNCTHFLGTGESKELVIIKIDSKRKLLSKLPPKLIALIETLRKEFEEWKIKQQEPKINSWVSWLEALEKNNIDDAKIAINAYSQNWDTSKFFEDSDLSEDFANRLSSFSEEAEQAVKLAIPRIFNAFFEKIEEAKLTGTKPIALSILELIILTDSSSKESLEISCILLEMILENGVDNHEYGAIIRNLSEIQEKISSPMHLSWSLDICEKLLFSPVPKLGKIIRREFFELVVRQSQEFAHKINSSDAKQFDYLCQDFETDSDILGNINVKFEDPELEIRDHEKRNIVIYTLSESAGRRAKTMLQLMLPGSKVTINSDKVATKPLENLAKNADIFIFAWRSSTHPAFYCVKDHVDKNALIMAKGKGTSSIVSAVKEKLR